ncbi:MAG: selenocysteine-specific translation elongation factor [Thermodesulfobacteriota bacterium]
MKQIILGTAGHIDHGKTSLIKALTGTDTDRLKEEKERGITIELGFAALDLPSGQHLGIVDVPGHEKFVKNMVAGATGIDLVAMVIAADEGVMPQTREHMEICSLLDIRYGLVVLTKVDMVDEEMLELATEDVRDFVRGTFLEGAPIVNVSSITGQGLPELLTALDQLSARIPDQEVSTLFRLPVDRVFSMKGFGTVITGSLISGRIAVGETIMVYPSRITSKVRGIQVHNQSVETAFSGMRTAINFQGLEKTAVNRGDVLARPDTLKPGYMIDLQLQFLSSNEKPMKNRTRVRFHTGTSEIMGNIILLDREELAPGETAIVQIRLDTPVSLVKQDRFVIRSYSPVRTIGGGQVLNPIPVKYKRFKPEIIAGLEKLIDGPAEALIEFHAGQARFAGVSFTDLILMTNLPEKQLQTAISGLLSRKHLIQIDKENRVFLHGDAFGELQTACIGILEQYHKKNPLKGGMPREELRSKLPEKPDAKLINLVMGQLVKSGRIVQAEDSVRLADHAVSLAVDQAEVSRKIVAIYKSAELSPPYFTELSKTLEIDAATAKAVLLLLVEQREIVKVKEDLYFHRLAIESLKTRLVDFLKAKGELSTPQFKEMTEVSRKYLIPLLEFFDSQNVTIRVGDLRKLRNA